MFAALFLLFPALPAAVVPGTVSSAAGTLAEVGFEDGTAMGFAARGTPAEIERGTGTYTVTEEAAHSGKYSLVAENRQQNWNGPALRIDPYVEVGGEYQITFWVKIKSPDSDTFRLSTQIGTGGGASYVNITSRRVSQTDDWVEITGKYLYTSDGEGFITAYIETGDKETEFYIDDFSIASLGDVAVIEADLSLPPLKDIYQDYFLIGSIFSNKDLSGERYKTILHHFNAMTAENAMKPEAMQPVQGSLTFDAADAMVDFVAADGMAVAGHALLWHQQTRTFQYQNEDGTPLTRAEAIENLTMHVKGVAEHYKGKLLCWDVVNEAIVDSPVNPSDWKSAGRNSMWARSFANGADESKGESAFDYIELAFRLAREADPEAMLYYNDYNLDDQDKAAAVAYMVKDINDKYKAEGNDRNLIDGVGMQGHYSVGVGIDNVEASIKRFISIGVEISVTELDVTTQNMPDSGMTPEGELYQAMKYAELFSLYKKYSDHIARVTLWGLDDASSWRSSQYPMIFNGDLSPKQAFYAIADPEGFIATGGELEAAVERSWAAYGTPVIDGEVDDIWKDTAVININRQLFAWENTATGTARVLWDKDNLYVLFEVLDADLDNTGSAAYLRDSVEAFVDEINCKNGDYQDCDGQYRVGYDGEQSFGRSTDSEGFESAVKVSGSGYTVEMKIPFKTIKPEAKGYIGFEAQINDASGGDRVGVAKWSDVTDNSSVSTKGLGVLQLIAPKDGGSDGGDQPAPTPTPTPATPTPAPEGGSDGLSTGLVILIVVGGLAVVGVGAFLIMKKR